MKTVTCLSLSDDLIKTLEAPNFKTKTTRGIFYLFLDMKSPSLHQQQKNILEKVWSSSKKAVGIKTAHEQPCQNIILLSHYKQEYTFGRVGRHSMLARMHI